MQRSNLSCLFLVTLFLLTSVSGCDVFTEKRFTLLKPEYTGVDFRNDLEPDSRLNIFNYLYFYDGAGVAAGDLNGDGLPDLFFTANQGQNELYINRGDLQFEEATAESIGSDVDDWSTGVTFVDINDDGRLDIYVSNVGRYLNIDGRNKLYVNQGNNEEGIPLFEEQAEEYGLDLVGFSTQAAFLDYDLDGDLDMYMMNHSVHSNATYDYATLREENHPLAGDRLMRNDGGTFTDVTEESGIYSSALGYGLGIGITDFNGDGYPDIYIGNDFHEDDYLYLNNGDGTFTEALDDMIEHTSRSSMGNDLVDINNDGLIDILSLDMLPEEYEKLKTSAAEDPYDIYQYKLDYGYKHQLSRNTLQLNRGNGHFSEIGVLAGIHATDWSWAGLGADFDHNGYIDIFVSNGIMGRSNDLDYIDFITRDSIQERLRGPLSDAELDLVKHMPAVRIPNYFYSNDGSLQFEDVSEQWGVNQPSYSSGAAYADLDGDGDLDLVVNNTDDEAFIYRNNTSERYENSNFLKIKLDGPPGNRFGIGTKVTIQLEEDSLIMREMYPVRGFQSSMDYELHAGTDSMETIPELKVLWPDGKTEILNNVAAGQTLELKYDNASYEENNPPAVASNRLIRDITDTVGVSYKHEENKFVEFNREALIPHMVSREGPALAVGDVNGDGLDDFYVGGAKRRASALYLQQSNGSFIEHPVPAFEQDSGYEDVDAVLSDIDLDGDPDLIVASGGNEYSGTSEFLLPRIYMNDGSGNFVRDDTRMPETHLNASVIAVEDITGNGFPDLFIGARSVPWRYGVPPESHLFLNERGYFRDDTTSLGTRVKELGMITDAAWADMNSDGYPDLIIAAEWEPVKIIFHPEGEAQQADVFEIPGSSGLWNTLEPVDLDRDGKTDIVAGNLGLNSKFKASAEAPLKMYVNDFDDNGYLEQIITYTDAGEERLFATKDELGSQLDYINERFKTYKEFSEASLYEVIDRGKLRESVAYSIEELRSGVFYNRGESGNSFEKKPLPMVTQFSPVRAILSLDINRNAYPDIITGGNFYEPNIQRGRYDADFGNTLINDGDGRLVSVPNKTIDWYLKGAVRQIEPIRINGRASFIVGVNNDHLQFFEFSENHRNMVNR